MPHRGRLRHFTALQPVAFPLRPRPCHARSGASATSFALAGHELIAFDSPARHAFTFTPAMSLFVECESEAELDAAYAKLAEGGAVLMSLGGYGFSSKFGWVNDRYGVSWQLNLA